MEFSKNSEASKEALHYQNLTSQCKGHDIILQLLPKVPGVRIALKIGMCSLPC